MTIVKVTARGDTYFELQDESGTCVDDAATLAEVLRLAADYAEEHGLDTIEVREENLHL